MDNFFCSHRCLLTEVMLVRGALGVSSTCASRSSKLASIRLLAPNPFLASAPVFPSLVISHFSEVSACPIPKPRAGYVFSDRLRNDSLFDPSMQRRPIDA
jgi:hypothetical protein